MQLSHIQLLDSALPIGGFSHSFGLETLVQQGKIRTVSELKSYAETMLFQVWAPSDALGIKAVYLYAPQEQWGKLWQVDQMLHVARPARETREGLHKMGKRLVQLARAMHPHLPWAPLVESVEARLCPGCHPTVYGWITYHLGVPLEDAATGYLYNCLLSSINNAVRLMALGQTQAQVLLSELLPSMPQAWQMVAEREPCDFYTSAPGTEVAMMQHETLYSRLFMS
jgi:urease accessory protein